MPINPLLNGGEEEAPCDFSPKGTVILIFLQLCAYLHTTNGALRFLSYDVGESFGQTDKRRSSTRN
jgi:hypothetical protein